MKYDLSCFCGSKNFKYSGEDLICKSCGAEYFFIEGKEAKERNKGLGKSGKRNE